MVDADAHGLAISFGSFDVDDTKEINMDDVNVRTRDGLLPSLRLPCCCCCSGVHQQSHKPQARDAIHLRAFDGVIFCQCFCPDCCTSVDKAAVRMMPLATLMLQDLIST